MQPSFSFRTSLSVNLQLQETFARSSQNFCLEEYVCSPATLPVQSVKHYTMLVNRGAALPVATRSNGEWTRATVPEGNIIALLCPGPVEEIKWEADCHALVISFEPSFVAQLLQADIGSEPHWNVFDPLLTELGSKLYESMSATFSSEQLYTESLAVATIMQFFRNIQGTRDRHGLKGRLSPEQLKQVIDYAHEGLHQDVGLEQMAGLVHLSPYHFGRLFKQTLGVSPYQYVLQMKIQYAKKLIRQKSGPIGEIAYQLNFSDQAHFSNAFRKATGISPRQYQVGLKTQAI